MIHLDCTCLLQAKGALGMQCSALMTVNEAVQLSLAQLWSISVRLLHRKHAVDIQKSEAGGTAQHILIKSTQL